MREMVRKYTMYGKEKELDKNVEEQIIKCGRRMQNAKLQKYFDNANNFNILVTQLVHKNKMSTCIC